ncbi:hypothetical protein GCM10010324_68160 [Streptomyces hiroshimensis]|uniref:Uncharacterized protein n=1 Tax=Streptomyces hiroshimensis TaxID=66424 RepID=A0ABQ2ZC35_9ACTN|nr:hypothetical protein GCM10010324_68160 [Streptomyces hiroshimensis]
MDQSLSLQSVLSWFVVLPDSDAAAAPAAKALSFASRSLLHASGRPWIVGRWTPGTVVTGTHRDTRVAVMGSTPSRHSTPNGPPPRRPAPLRRPRWTASQGGPAAST